MHILSQFKIFEGLEENELAALHAIAHPIRVEENEYIFREGTPGDRFYIILEGEVQIIIENAGHEQDPDVVAILETNEIFGELAIFDDSVRSASALTLGPSSLLEFRKDALEELFKKNNHIGMTVMKNLGHVLCERLRAVDKVFKEPSV